MAQIVICIPTFRRPGQLDALLTSLAPDRDISDALASGRYRFTREDWGADAP